MGAPCGSSAAGSRLLLATLVARPAPSWHRLPVNRTERLYAVTEELRATGPAGLTAGRLAERLRVSVRTVKRDVAALVDLGVPVLSQTDGPGATGSRPSGARPRWPSATRRP